MELHFSVRDRRESLKTSVRMAQNVTINRLFKAKQNLKSSLKVPIGSSLQLMMEQFDAEGQHFLDGSVTSNVTALTQPEQTAVSF